VLSFIENVLNEFRPVFKRLATFKWFVICVIAMMLRSDHLGVTSVIRDLSLAPECYEVLIHFFRSNAYNLDALREQWYRCVVRNAPLAKCRNRIILVGDGVKQSKEALKMPGVKKMTQESETCSKPQFIHGHLFGALGVIASTAAKRFCMPLKINIQDGLRSASDWPESSGIVDISNGNHIEQMIQCAFEAARILGKSYILLDRYFLSKTALRLMDKMNLERPSDEGNLVEIITKAKSNCKAYMKPIPKRPGARGRTRKKGKHIFLWELFDCPQRFTTAWVCLYGKREQVSYYCTNLLWGQGLYKELRFVLVKRGTGEKSILVSTDLTLRPKNIIELYGGRFSCESLFREMKQQVGAFSYHFWTKYMPKLNHFAKKEDSDKLSGIINSHARKKILSAVKAIESFVFCATVATGLLQMLSLNSCFSVRIAGMRYLRTKSSEAPSEGTVMYYLRKRIFLLLSKSPDSFVTQYILEKQEGDFRQKQNAG
jgi:hypothetical protein